MAEDRMRVLVVDDERAIRRFLQTALTAHGYDVVEAATGEEALTATVAQRPDLIILDLGLPGIGGVEVARRLREWTNLPILVLSVCDQEESKIEALDAGADDYLTKPFGIGELLARIRVAVRRASQPQGGPLFETGDLVVDLARRLVLRAGEQIALTPTEYDLLRVLVSNSGRVMTHSQLLNRVWGPGYQGELHLLRVNVSNLRRKIEPVPSRPSIIVTEPGVGYRMQLET
ncbi:MAG: response regulator [Anaerolineales bacterium]|nr:response regulator [Anaerolineales bacterium]